MIEGMLIEGLIFGIMVLGVFSTYRVLNFCDMTVDGSFPMGGAIMAVLLLNGINPTLSILAVLAAGILAGLATTFIYTKFRIPDLLSGILIMTMLYSVNLRIMGCSNKSLLDTETIFTGNFVSLFPGDWGIVILTFIFAAIINHHLPIAVISVIYSSVAVVSLNQSAMA